ncbi:MAG: hypothetical protein KDJ48_09295 [Nitratireductor sp.]|nr:hypothetical protein [Nitratireductor sp.]
MVIAPELAERSEEFLAAERAMRFEGKAMPVGCIPLKFTGAYSDSLVKPPTTGVFNVGGWMAVTEAAAAIFRQFDLGDGGLVPIEFFQNDQTTRVEGNYFILNIGAIKSAFLPKKSRRVRRNMFIKDRWSSSDIRDLDIAIDKSALEGPDLWVDSRVYTHFFISDALGQALIDADLASGLFMSRCRIAEPFFSWFSSR